MIYAILVWPLLGATFYPYQRWASAKQGQKECCTIWYCLVCGALGWLTAVPLILCTWISIILNLLGVKTIEEV